MKVIGTIVLLLEAAFAIESPQFMSNSAGHTAETTPRISGGTPAKQAIAPFMASISGSKLKYEHICAGTVIGREWILTAAHCAANISIGTPVYVGFNDHSQLNSAQVRYLDFVFSHKGFNGLPGSEDIALAHVSEAFAFGPRVRPVYLPTLMEEYKGELKTYGWGQRQSSDNKFSTTLTMSSANRLMDFDECKLILPENAPIIESNICATISACYGDGGSPLVKERPGGITEIVGITSWGYVPCGQNQLPTVYTSVPKVLEWIEHVQGAYYVFN